MISLVVPVYNVSEYIGECLMSIHSQGGGGFECIFVDDCGSDNSIEVVERFIFDNDLVNWRIVRHENNRGLSAARNTGAIYAQGDYLLFVDSDDVLAEGAIAAFRKTIADEQADMLLGSYKTFPAERTIRNIAEGRLRLDSDQALKLYSQGKIIPTAWNKLVSKATFQRSGGFKEGILHEDLLWTPLALCAADAIVIVDKVTYLYRCRQGSIMNSAFSDRNVRSYDAILDGLKEWVGRKKVFRRLFVAKGVELTMYVFVKSSEARGISFMRKHFAEAPILWDLRYVAVMLASRLPDRLLAFGLRSLAKVKYSYIR